MERPWPEESLDFEQAVSGAFERAGGLELARSCESDPGLRTQTIGPILAELGVLELALDQGEVEAAAAARALYAAGAVICPWPLAQQLAVPSAQRASIGAVYLVADGRAKRAEHLDLLEGIAALDLDALAARELRALADSPSAMPLDPFGVRCELGGDLAVDLADAYAAYVILASFWVAGALRSARDLASEYARDRRQFNRPIAAFGGVQWHLSEIALAHDGLWELAGFSLARLIDRSLSRSDVLALHLTMLESAQILLPRAHQVMGAIGLCDEHHLTLITRHLQPLVRRPCGEMRVAGMFADELLFSGFDGVYGVPPSIPDSESSGQAQTKA